MEVPTWMKIISLLIAIIGCPMGAVMITRDLLTFIRVKKAGCLVQGKIIDFKESRNDEGISYPAVVSYKTFEGEEITATAITSSGAKPMIGKHVWVVYDPQNHSHFYFRRTILPFFHILFILACIFLFMLAAFDLYKILITIK